ncbi:hypothetical protein H8R18_04075 [Nanchangia anserum]|uniref:ATP-grasp domain-containing protein n=1 Tax=Nanchangia anserum TaxID=2692125 RepID=A0A8I0GAU3_9ACTO|nr:hypothetical protein [Nanchangia anserum]MBD3688735.1 hypothetical protein [Nanchangia anserum]QOX82478.1 hypothetical protein H8R18_04075 [Nanchangia anserum]
MAIADGYGNDDFVPVILGTGLGAYTIARSLHMAYGVRSLALGRARLGETAHSAILDVIEVPNFDQPDTVIATLREVAGKFPTRRPILFSTIEMYSTIIAEHHDELARLYTLPCIDAEAQRTLAEKDHFYAACDRAGLVYPTTDVLGPGDVCDQARLDARGLTFPLILKPTNTDIYPRLNFAGRKKVYLISTLDELVSTIARIRAGGYDDGLILQRYLSGNESVMRVANTYSDTDGRLRAICVGQVAVTDRHPQRVGNNNAIVALRDDALTEKIRSFLDAHNYRGFANFDFLLDRDSGDYHVLEANLRLGASSFYTLAGNVNLVRHCVDDMVYGSPRPFEAAEQAGLWMTIPYPVVRRHCAPELRPLVTEAASHRRLHTLWYSKDLSPQRVVSNLRMDARLSRDTLRYAEAELNS